MPEPTINLIEYKGYLWSFKVVHSEKERRSTLICNRTRFEGEVSGESSATVTDSLIIAHPCLFIVACQVVTEYRSNCDRLFVLLCERNSKVPRLKLVCADHNGLQLFLNFECSSRQAFSLAVKVQSNDSTKYNPSFTSEIIKSGVCLPGDISFEPDGITGRIINGPNICVVSQNTLYVTANLTSGCTQFILNINGSSLVRWSLLHISLDMTGTLTTILSIDTVPENDQTIVKSDTSAKGFLGFDLNCNMEQNGKLNRIDLQSMLPSIYANTLTCMEVVSLASHGSKGMISCCNRTGNKIAKNQCQILLCTTESQLIYLEDGKVEDCTWLTFSNAKSIVTFEATPDAGYVGVLSADSTFCIVDMTSFCIQVVVECVCAAFVGDFISNGAEQLLLLSSSATSASSCTDVDAHDSFRKRFILTDLNGVHIDTLHDQNSSEDHESTGDTSSSLASAVTALGSRLQAGLVGLQTAHRQTHRHTAMIAQACHDLQNMRLAPECGIKSTRLQDNRDGLVPLIGGPSSLHPNPTEKCQETIGLQTSDIWTRIMHNKLLIGLKLFNGTHWRMEKPELCVLNQDSLPSLREIKSRSISIHYHNENYSEESSHTVHITDRDCADDTLKDPKSKKRKLDSDTPLSDERKMVIKEMAVVPPGGTIHVIAVVDNFQMTCSKSRCLGLVLASTLVGTLGGTSDGEAEFVGIPLARSCGTVRVDVKAMFDCLDAAVLAESSEVESLLALHAVQQTIQLALESCATPITPCLISTLVHHLGFSHQSTLDCYIATRPVTMATLRVKVETVGRNSAKLLCHFIDTSQLTVFIHLLYNHLPEDILIKPSASEALQHEQLLACINAMHKETSLYTTQLRHIMSQHSLVSATDLQKTDGEDASSVEATRARFESSQRRLMECERRTCTRHVLEGLISAGTELERNTDQQVTKVATLEHKLSWF